MLGRSIGVLLLVGSGLGLVACGGKAKGNIFGGGAGNGGTSEPSGGNTPPGGYQTPPPGYEAPPPGYEAPPPNYDNPGGAGTDACVQLCNAFVNRTCGGQVITAADVAECPGECRTLITDFDPCGAEYGALLSCMLRSQFFQDLLDAACAGEDLEVNDEDAEKLFAQCGQQAVAFEACFGDRDPGSNPEPDPPGQTCDIKGDQCTGCFDDCERCECSLGASSETCIAICDPPA